MLAEAAPLLAVLLHTLAIYLFLILCLSLLSRREIAQLTSVELVIVMVLGSAVETAMVAGNTSLGAGLVSAGALLVANRLLTLALRRWRLLRRLIVGSPLILVRDGHLVPKNLRRAGFTPDDVTSALRERGYVDLAKIRFAVLEIDGSVGVVPADAPMHGGKRLPSER